MIFKENGLNVIHIESRKSKRATSEYEIFVNLESQTNDRVPVPKVIKSLKRQLSYVQIVGEQCEKLLNIENGERKVEKSVQNEIKADNESTKLLPTPLVKPS